MGTEFGSGFCEIFSNNLSDNTACLLRVTGQQNQSNRQRHKHKRVISLGKQPKNNLAFRYLQHITNACYVTTQFLFFSSIPRKVCVCIHTFIYLLNMVKYSRGLSVMLSKASVHAEFKNKMNAT